MARRILSTPKVSSRVRWESANLDGRRLHFQRVVQHLSSTLVTQYLQDLALAFHNESFYRHSA